MLSRDERRYLIECDDEPREFGWGELFPSVFAPHAEFKPLFSALGNEAGDWRINVRWSKCPWGGVGPVGMITVCTADPQEGDIDRIEDQTTWIWFRDRDAFREAWSLARDIAAGKLFPPLPLGMDVVDISARSVGGITIQPSPHHKQETA